MHLSIEGRKPEEEGVAVVEVGLEETAVFIYPPKATGQLTSPG